MLVYINSYDRWLASRLETDQKNVVTFLHNLDHTTLLDSLAVFLSVKCVHFDRSCRSNLKFGIPKKRRDIAVFLKFQYFLTNFGRGWCAHKSCRKLANFTDFSGCTAFSCAGVCISQD